MARESEWIDVGAAAELKNTPLRPITTKTTRIALSFRDGEFGAVSVVSGHIRGETNTMPLLVEILYNEYQFVASFAIASLLAFLALVTLIVKTVLESHLEEGQPASDD